MRHKQSELDGFSPKSFLKTAIFSNKTTKNGDFWKLYGNETEISFRYISVKCRKTDTNPTEKCENTVAHLETYHNITILVYETVYNTTLLYIVFSCLNASNIQSNFRLVDIGKCLINYADKMRHKLSDNFIYCVYIL